MMKNRVKIAPLSVMTLAMTTTSTSNQDGDIAAEFKNSEPVSTDENDKTDVENDEPYINVNCNNTDDEEPHF